MKLKIERYLGISRTALAKHLSDLFMSSVVALFVAVLVWHYIGTEQLLVAMNYEPNINLLSIFSKPKLGLEELLTDSNTSSLIIFSLTIGLTIALVLVYSYFHINFSKSETKRIKKLSTKYQNYFIELISSKQDQLSKYFQDNNSEKLHLSKEDLLDVNKRAVLLKELKAMHALINGTEKQRLNEIYYSLGFVDELVEKYKSPDWVERAEAIKETEQFKVTKCYLMLQNLVNDSNETVRQNAMLAKIKLDNNPILILSEIDRPLNIWEKHHLALIIKKMPAHKLPNFIELAKQYSLQ